MNCPCCSDTLLRHADKGGLYWVCPTCRQVMPLLQTKQGRNRNPVLLPPFSEDI